MMLSIREYVEILIGTRHLAQDPGRSSDAGWVWPFYRQEKLPLGRLQSKMRTEYKKSAFE